MPFVPVLTPDEQAFIDKAVADFHAGLILFSFAEPRVIRAIRMMADQQHLSAQDVGDKFNKSRAAVLSLSSRVKPPIYFGGHGVRGGRKRKHVKVIDADITKSNKYARLVSTINDINKKYTTPKTSITRPLTTRCPKCSAAIGEPCYTVRHGIKITVKRHKERMQNLRALGAEPKTESQIKKETTSPIRRNIQFRRFNDKATQLPGCVWFECKDPVMAAGKPYCSVHHSKAYGAQNAVLRVPVNKTTW